MLSPDISLEQISELLDKKLDEKLDKNLDEKLAPVYRVLDLHTKILNEHTSILNEHTTILNEHSRLLSSHEKLLKSHDKRLKSLKNDQTVMLEMLDGEQMDQRKRLTEVEKRLSIAPVL